MLFDNLINFCMVDQLLRHSSISDLYYLLMFNVPKFEREFLTENIFVLKIRIQE